MSKLLEALSFLYRRPAGAPEGPQEAYDLLKAHLTPKPLEIKEYGDYNVPVASCPKKGCDRRYTPFVSRAKFCPKCGQAWDTKATYTVPEVIEHHEGVVL